MVELFVTPHKRQVIVVTTRGKQVAFAVGCRMDTKDGKVTRLITGVADGTGMTDGEFRESVEQGNTGLRTRYPEAEMMCLNCPDGMRLLDFVKLEAERRVEAW